MMMMMVMMVIIDDNDDHHDIPVTGGKWNRLDAVSAEHNQLWVACVAVHDQQVEDRYCGPEDLQLLLEIQFQLSNEVFHLLNLVFNLKECDINLQV